VYLAFPFVLAFLPVRKGAVLFISLIAMYLLGSKVDYTKLAQ
jgi:hypothetical protein